MNPFQEYAQNITRRHFFSQGSHALGWAALSTLLAKAGLSGIAAGAEGAAKHSAAAEQLLGRTHFPGKAKRVIYLHMVGGPSQLDLYDYKPVMNEWYDKDLPESVRMGQRLTTMTSGQKRFPIAPSMFKFAQHGKCGMWVSELLPYTAKMVDEMCFIRSMHTEAINHEPAITLFQTGNQITGRPCLGAWTSYGLGTANENLPTFVVLVAKPTNTEQVQAISARLWQSGYLPGVYSGVSFRSGGDPILYINNPPGVPSDIRRKTLDGLRALNEMNYNALGDPETHTRIQQYELAYRMQTSVPELTDLTKEPESTYKLYGEEAKKPGSFAHTALMARRMAERGVRFIQVYHNNWDTHGNVAGRLPDQCRDVDQPCWGLVQDLKQRGMLDETLIIWGGEFGRTIYSQGGLSKTNYGRDHHPRCFTMWMCGGGFKGGTIYGETDDFSYNIIKDPCHIRDWHATVLNQLGFDHERFTVKHLGLDQRLTGVEPAKVIKGANNLGRGGTRQSDVAGSALLRHLHRGGCAVAELEERIAEIDARWPGFDARLRGYCFFIDQNLPERLTESTELSVYFGYGWLSADREPVEPEEYERQALGIAREVCQCLREEGLEVDWDGSFAKKFGVSVDWRRRELLT